MSYSSENKYQQEISDLGDVGHMLSELLEDSSVKDELWDIFEDVLVGWAISDLKEVLEWWWEEKKT